MKLIFEIYLNKNFVTKEEWEELIKVISNYNGLLRKWKIIITNDKNLIRYYVKTKCSLPSTINNLNSFLLKQTNELGEPKSKYTLITIPKIGSSIIDLINYNEVKNKGNLIYLEITFKKICKDIIASNVRYYLNKNGRVIKYKCLFTVEASILSSDFGGNKRYFYKSSPNYLDINKILHLLNTDNNNALLSVDTFPYLQGNFYLNQNSFNFDKHSIILGSSGSGKSKFISLFIYNIYKNDNLRQKYKIVVIDPHTSLENDIGGFSRVIDFKSINDSIDLFINNSDDIIESTELLLELLKSLIISQYNSKLERVLRHSIHLLLTNKTFNFKFLRKILLDLEYRNNLIKELKSILPPSVIDFFLADFNDLKTKSYGEAISPIIGFIDEMEMLPVFNKENKYENLKKTIDDNFLTLFSLDRTKLGDKVTKTISGLIMEQLWNITCKREIDKHIIFIIDEVSVLENPILSRYLSEARKYNLSLILAGQYFNQITEDLKNSIFANVINYFIFRVSKIDANILVDNFNIKIPLDNSRDKKVSLLTELQARECITRIDANGVLLPVFKGVTLDYESIPRIKIEETIKESKNDNKSNTKFSLKSNTSLKDIMILNSTNKKGCEKNE